MNLEDGEVNSWSVSRSKRNRKLIRAGNACLQYDSSLAEGWDPFGIGSGERGYLCEGSLGPPSPEGSKPVALG